MTACLMVSSSLYAVRKIIGVPYNPLIFFAASIPSSLSLQVNIHKYDVRIQFP